MQNRWRDAISVLQVPPQVGWQLPSLQLRAQLCGLSTRSQLFFNETNAVESGSRWPEVPRRALTLELIAPIATQRLEFWNRHTSSTSRRIQQRRRCSRRPISTVRKDRRGAGKLCDDLALCIQPHCQVWCRKTDALLGSDGLRDTLAKCFRVEFGPSDEHPGVHDRCAFSFERTFTGLNNFHLFSYFFRFLSQVS